MDSFCWVVPWVWKDFVAFAIDPAQHSCSEPAERWCFGAKRSWCFPESEAERSAAMFTALKALPVPSDGDASTRHKVA
jgi:hypothetical protein